MNKITAAVVGVLIAAGSAIAAKPINVSITPDMALFDRQERIEGLVIGLWSENPQRALALGIVNGSSGRSTGMSVAFVLNYADDYTGIHWAPINYTKGEFVGWQSGVVNYVGGTMKGIQSGAVNYARRLTGVQLGVFNYAETVDTGLQLGLLNIIPQNEWFRNLPNELAPGMIIANWRF